MPKLTSATRSPLRPASWLMAATLAIVPAAADPADESKSGKSESPLVSTLIMPQNIYESGETMRGELSLTNTSKEWLRIADASGLTKALSLVTEDGKSVEPQNIKLFGAARTENLGPGGFVGFTFDAAVLFPRLEEPGRYTLRFAPEGAAPREASLRVLPAFDPKQDYWLSLETASGTLAIDLDERGAPAAVQHIARLVRLNHYEKAHVVRLQPGFAFKVEPKSDVSLLPAPFEPTAAPLLAGSVILEPMVSQGITVNSTNMVVLLGPQVGQEGRATVVGQVVGSRDVLARLSSLPTSGAEGSPPWQPESPIEISAASLIEKRR